MVIKRYERMNSISGIRDYPELQASAGRMDCFARYLFKKPNFAHFY